MQHSAESRLSPMQHSGEATHFGEYLCEFDKKKLKTSLECLLGALGQLTDETTLGRKSQDTVS
jgi:hypothetical protein